MKAPLTILFCWLAWPAPGQLSLRSPSYAACFLKPMMSAAAYPGGEPHYWTMNEAATNPRDDSVGALDLSESSAVLSVAGKNGNAAMISLVGGAGNSLSAGSALPNPTDYTVSVWVWPATSADLQGRITLDSDGDSFIQMNVFQDGTAQYSAGDGEAIVTGTGVNLEQWNLVVFFKTASLLGISVNGGNYITDVATSPDTPGIIRFDAFAGFQTLANAFGFDEGAFYSRALTQQEVTDTWNGGTGRFGP